MNHPAITSDLRALTRSPSEVVADWGRPVSLALEYLAVQVAFRSNVPERGVFIGRDVALHFDASGNGVTISARLLPRDFRLYSDGDAESGMTS